MTHSIELKWLQYIHSFRTPFLDAFFKAWNFFDRIEFFLVLIPVIWLCAGWRSGLRLFYILTLSSLANYYIKEVFSLPRPYVLDPSLAVLQIKGFTFPSGSAQTAVLGFGFLLAYWKSSLRWPTAIAFFTLLSFSRLYLGAHFPSDLLGGWIVGLGLLGIYFYIFPFIERKLSTMRPIFLFILSMSITLALLCTLDPGKTQLALSAATGLNLGLFINRIFRLSLPLPQNRKEAFFRVFLGTSLSFSCYKLLASFPLPYVLQIGLFGLCLSVHFPLACKTLSFRKKGSRA
jgi:undecaprenyl-diphosphatase